MIRPLALILLMTLAACGRADKEQPSDGRALYKALNCRACHKIGAEGASRGGPDLTMVGARKSRAWLDLFLADPQAWKKDTLMPNPRLSATARAAIVDYLSSLKGQDWKEGRPWSRPELKSDVERGHVLYARAGCVTCHGVSGAGGYPNNNVPGGLVPALNNVSETFTKGELKKKIAKGVVPEKKNPSSAPPLLDMPAWGQVLSDQEIDAVVEYLWTLKPGGAKSSDW